MSKNNIGKELKNIYFIATALLLVFVCGLIATFVYAKAVNSKVHTISFDWSIDSTENEEIIVFATPGTTWLDDDEFGIQYDVDIYNYSDYPLSNWKVTIAVPEGTTLGNSWNGNWFLEGTQLTCKPENFNSVVSAHSNSSFGFLMTSSIRPYLNEISMEYHIERRVDSYGFYWISIVGIILTSVFLIISFVVSLKMKHFEKTNMVYKDLVNESLRTIANIIDTKDEYTKGHSVRVAIYSKRLAQKLGMDEKEQERIYHIGLLHDIGKIGIPVSILTKPGRLTDEEFEIIKRHPAMGSTIMKDFSSIPGVQYGIRYHHERYDGKGYNEGLSGIDIPLEGRIICVADSYDAMSSRRCYRNSLSYDFILDELRRNSGTQFDPDIAACMIELIEAGQAPLTAVEEEEYGI